MRIPSYGRPAASPVRIRSLGRESPAAEGSSTSGRPASRSGYPRFSARTIHPSAGRVSALPSRLRSGTSPSNRRTPRTDPADRRPATARRPVRLPPCAGRPIGCYHPRASERCRQCDSSPSSGRPFAQVHQWCRELRTAELLHGTEHAGVLRTTPVVDHHHTGAGGGEPPDQIHQRTSGACRPVSRTPHPTCSDSSRGPIPAPKTSRSSPNASIPLVSI